MFYVYYDAGSCNMNDHDYGLERCDTFKEAETFVDKLRAGGDLFRYEIRIIEGQEVQP